jgi:hypothetical protein
MTTLCLCDWVESAEHRAWRATTSPSLAACQSIRPASLGRDRFTENVVKSGTARFGVPSNTLIQEYVS